MKPRLISTTSKVKELSQDKILFLNDFVYLCGNDYYTVSIDKTFEDKLYFGYKNKVKTKKTLISIFDLYNQYSPSLVAKTINDAAFPDDIKSLVNSVTNDNKDRALNVFRNQIKLLNKEIKELEEGFNKNEERGLILKINKKSLKRSTESGTVKLFTEKLELTTNILFMTKLNPLVDNMIEDLGEDLSFNLKREAETFLREKTNFYKKVRF